MSLLWSIWILGFTLLPQIIQVFIMILVPTLSLYLLLHWLSGRSATNDYYEGLHQEPSDEIEKERAS